MNASLVDDEGLSVTTSDAIIRLLEMRHPAPWAAFPELRCGTGFPGPGRREVEQRFDFFALNTWPSSRFHSVAYEIKTSRADFLRELRQPGKRAFAEKIASECFFAMPPGLTRVDEIPDGWGMIEVTKGGLRVRKAALQRTPEPWPLFFVASIARRSGEKPERSSKTMWLHAGREVDEAMLLKIAEEHFQRVLADERAALAWDAVAAFRNSPEGRRLSDLRDAVVDVTGMYGVDAAKFRGWANELRASSLSPALRADLERLHAALGRVVEVAAPATTGSDQ